MAEITFQVPVGFRDYAEALLVRLGYLYPDVAFTYDSQACEVRARWGADAVAPSELEREIRFQLYRERVYAETLPIRRRLYGDG